MKSLNREFTDRVQRAVDDAAGDRVAAFRVLRAGLLPGEERMLADFALWFAVRNAVSRNRRGPARRPVPLHVPRGREGIVAVAKSRWARFYLPDGGPALLEATAAELEVALHHYNQKRGQLDRRHCFLLRVREKVLPGRTVRTSMSDDIIDSIYQEAYGEPFKGE